MTLTTFFSLWLLATPPASPIQSYELEAKVIRTIPVASNTGTTTIVFPGPIDGLRAARVVSNPKEPGDFLLSHHPGRHDFTLRALKPEASDVLTVLYQHEAYVLRLKASDTPAYTVRFHQLRPVAPVASPVSPARLLGLLDKAKAYHALAVHHPALLEDVAYTAFASDEEADIHLAEAWRFDRDDTLVFRVTITNPGDLPLRYDPAGFAVQTGDRRYPQVISDASGTVPPRSSTTAYFAVTGTPRGGRNNLSVHNDWTVFWQALPEEEVDPKAMED